MTHYLHPTTDEWDFDPRNKGKGAPTPTPLTKDELLFLAYASLLSLMADEEAREASPEDLLTLVLGGEVEGWMDNLTDHNLTVLGIRAIRKAINTAMEMKDGE